MPSPKTGTPDLSTPAASRPILHLGVSTQGREERLVTKGVFPDGRQLGTLVQTPGGVWSPDGVWIAHVTQQGQGLKLVNLQGQEETILETFDWEPIYAWPVWSPDGRRIAVITVQWCEIGSRISSIVIIDVAEGRVLRRHWPYDFWEAGGTELGPTNITLPRHIRWSPDGRKILVSWDKVVVIDVVTGDAEEISPVPVLAEWAPDSDAVYYFEIEAFDKPRDQTLGEFFVKRLGAVSSIKLIDRERLTALGLTAQRPVLALMTLSPSGSRLAVAAGSTDGSSSNVHVYDLMEDETVAFAMPSQSFETSSLIAALEWAPDESSLAAAVVAEEGLNIDVLNLAEGDWTTLAMVPVELRQISGLGKFLSWTQ